MKPMKPLTFSADGPSVLSGDFIAAFDTDQEDGQPGKYTLQAGTDDSETVGGHQKSESQRPGRDATLCACLHLTWEDRVMGFAGCFVIGLALSLSSMLSFTQLLLGHPAPFAWKLSTGAILSLASSSFLTGPREQWRKMTSPIRVGATVAYCASIVANLLAALFLHNIVLTLITIIVQYCALAWYCASYIPFGRDLLRRCVGRVGRGACMV